jgi:hypothetical protein
LSPDCPENRPAKRGPARWEASGLAHRGAHRFIVDVRGVAVIRFPPDRMVSEYVEVHRTAVGEVR